MRRLFGIALAGALMMLPAFSHGTAFAQQAPQKTTFTGDMVLWAFNINADKAADFEAVLGKVKEALSKSERPEAKQQLAGWRVMKNAMAQPDGSLLYLLVISPVVKDADYSLMNNLYEVFKDPKEQVALYEQYRGAVKQVLFIIQGPIAADFSK